MKFLLPVIGLLLLSNGIYSQCATTPTITSFAPASGPEGTTVIITGTNFDPVAANNTVFFGNVRATPTIASATSLQVKVPVGATSQYFSVNRSCGATAMLQYGFHVTSACAGTLVSGTGGSYAAAVTYTADNRGYSAALGDLDGDGKPELAVANYIAVSGSPKVSLFQNLSTPGTVSFSSKTDYTCAGQLYGVYFFDIDMDGKLDLVGQATGNTIFVFRNISTTPGTIALAPKVDVTTTNGSWSVTFGDMDNDGKPDLIWGGFSTAIIARNLSTPGTISFAAAFPVTTQPSSAGFCNTTDVKVGDLDGDGKNDIVTAGYNCSLVGVARNISSPGTLAFEAPFTFAAGGQNHGVAIGDLNNDGKPEIVSVCRDAASCRVFENQATTGLSAASFLSPITLSAGASTILLEDINGDGKPEILCSNGGAVTAFPNNYTSGAISAASFGTPVGWSLSCGGTARMFSIGDVDGDGFIDMVSGRDASAPNALGEVIRRKPTPNFTALVPATTTGVTNFCNDLTWKYFYNLPGNDKLVAGLKDNGISTGIVTANAYVEGTAGTYNGQRYMRRHFKINSTVTPAGTTRVRLYYTATDFSDLQAAIPSLTTANQLAVTHYTGPAEDGVYNPQPTGTLEVILPAQITKGTAYGQSYLEFDITFLGEFWIHTGSYVLPISALSFEAQRCNNKVCLRWQTENEQSLSHFEIEKSSDGLQFQFVEKRTANNQLHNIYTATDDNPVAGVTYYRLKEVALNGQSSYSRQVKLVWNRQVEVSISPNPVKDWVTVNTGAPVMAVRLINASGQILQVWKATPGNRFDCSTYPAGIYSLQVITNESVSTHKISIIH